MRLEWIKAQENQPRNARKHEYPCGKEETYQCVCVMHSVGMVMVSEGLRKSKVGFLIEGLEERK